MNRRLLHCPNATTQSRRLGLTVTCAKGGSKSDKKGSKKGVSALSGLLKKKQEAEETKGGLALASPAQYRDDPEIKALLFALTTSYYRATKEYLIEVDLEQLPDAIFNADFVCLAHDHLQEGVTVPRYTYANKAGLELWEATWDEFIGLPSAQTTPDTGELRQEREKFYDQVAKHPMGYSKLAEAPRVSLKGTKYKLLDVILFNIVDFSGEKIGQAAVFNRYQLEDGTIVKIKSTEWQPQQVELPPTEDELKAAQAMLEEWSAYVRALKETQGLTNKDPEVQAAVAQLKICKDIVADLQKRMDEALAAAEAAFGDLEDEE